MAERYTFGLLGYPLQHSLSPLIHSTALQVLGFQGEYRLFPVEDKQDLPALLNKLRSGELQGLNVTIPHKRQVLEFLDVLTHTAQGIGAVNTIYSQGHRLVGENTDAGGFIADLKRLGWIPGESHPSRALILGAGGAARAVAYALYQRDWHLVIASRNLTQGQNLVASLTNRDRRKDEYGTVAAIQLDRVSLSNLKHPLDLVINATPLGMSPLEAASPWPADLPLPTGAAVYDLVYNPVDTVFTKRARDAGLQAANGIGMLVEQAALSFEIWTGIRPPRAEMHSALAIYQRGMR